MNGDPDTKEKLRTEEKLRRVDNARKWWESEGKEAREGGLQQVTEEELRLKLDNNAKWYNTAGNEGTPADFAGADLYPHRRQLNNADFTDADLRWANLYAARLQKARLWKARLQGAMLIDARFEPEPQEPSRAPPYLIRARRQGTELSGTIVEEEFVEDQQPPTKLRVADLTDADFRDAHLRDAKLSSVTGLRAQNLAGTDLTNAKLPPHIAKFDTLAHVEKTSQNASTTFFGLLAASLYSWLTIATTTDLELITERASSPLPIINTPISLAWFYWAAPLILLGVYLYLQLYLQRLWRDLSALPAVFPDGEALDEKAYPWLLNGLVRAHFFRLRLDQRPLSRLENSLSILLAWGVVPFTIFAFWLRYLPRHDWWGTGLHVVLVTIAMGFAVHSYRLAKGTLSGAVLPKHSAQDYRPDKWTTLLFALTLSLSALAMIKPTGPQSWRPSGQDWWPDPAAHVGTALAGYLSYVPTYRTYADLRDGEISVKPLDWMEGDETKFAQVKGADLRGRDLRQAAATGAFLVKARLEGADLRGADLSGADLRRANLSDADLRATDLRNVQFRGACRDEKTNLPEKISIKPCPER